MRAAKVKRKIVSRKKKKDLVQETSKIEVELPKACRDSKGRLLPGHTANPAGTSKKSQEFKSMCQHVLMNDGWDRWYERLNDEKTPAIVIHQMVEWMSAQVWGKPGVRKDDETVSAEQIAAMMPIFVIKNADRLREAGVEIPANPEVKEQ